MPPPSVCSDDVSLRSLFGDAVMEEAPASNLALPAGHVMSKAGRRSRSVLQQEAEERKAEGITGMKGLSGPSASVAQKPSHKKCHICIFFDDDEDPVEKHFGRSCLMLWGKPCGPNGETSGCYCHYCMKIYAAKIRGIAGMTITVYKQQLGDQKKHDKHMALQKVLIQKIIDNGGSSSSHVDWDALDSESLEVVRTMQAKVKRPGLSIYDLAEYLEEFGTVQTDKGHYKTIDPSCGSEVVVVPDRKIKRVEFSEFQNVNRRQQLGDTRDAVAPEDLDLRMRAIADSFQPDFGGKFLVGGGVEALLSGGCDDKSVHAASLTAGRPSSSGPLAFSPQSTPVKAKQPIETEERQQSASVAKRRAFGAAASAKANAGAASAQAAAGTASKAGRGRPKKDLVAEVTRVEGEFSKSLPTDVCWWGSEAKAIVKAMSSLDKDIDNRLRVEPDTETIQKLLLAKKKLVSMVSIVEEAPIPAVYSSCTKSNICLPQKLNMIFSNMFTLGLLHNLNQPI